MTNPNLMKRIEETLMELLRERYTSDDKETYRRLRVDSATQQILEIVRETLEAVIGEDEKLVKADDFQKRSLEIRRNELRAEQRANLEKLIGGKKSNVLET